MAEEQNWDEVLITNNPESKEIEVSFKKIDGDGFFGDEPGTPGGTIEDENGCVNAIGLVSDDVWLLQNGAPHWVWITLRSIPTEEYTVTLTFTDGTLLYPEYTTQTLDWLISPGSWEANEEGVTGIKVPLSLGDVSRLTDLGTDTAFYNAAITAVDGIAVDCWEANPVTLDFGPIPAEVPPEDTATGGEEIPGDNPECVAHECSAYTAAYPISDNFDLMLYDSTQSMFQTYVNPNGPDWLSIIGRNGRKTGLTLGAAFWSPSYVSPGSSYYLPEINGGGTTACLTGDIRPVNFSGTSGSLCSTEQTRLAQHEDPPQSFSTTYATIPDSLSNRNCYAGTSFACLRYFENDSARDDEFESRQVFFVTPSYTPGGNQQVPADFWSAGWEFKGNRLLFSYRGGDQTNPNGLTQGYTANLASPRIRINFKGDGTIGAFKYVPNNAGGTDNEQLFLSNGWDPTAQNEPIEMEYFWRQRMTLSSEGSNVVKTGDFVMDLKIRHAGRLTSIPLTWSNFVNTPSDSGDIIYRCILGSHPTDINSAGSMSEVGVAYTNLGPEGISDYTMFMVAGLTATTSDTRAQIDEALLAIARSFEGYSTPDYCNRIT